MSIRFVAVAALLLSSAASGAANPPLKPLGKWVVGSDPTCIIQRDFGLAEKPVRFELRTIPTLDAVTLSVTDDGRVDGDEFVPATVSFGATQPPIQRPMEIYQIKGSKSRFGWLSLDKQQLREALQTGLIMLKSNGMNVSLAVPDLSDGIEALDACEASELESWGMSREKQRAIASWPDIDGPAAKYVSSQDYPRDALVEMSTGVNSARVKVDDKGIPSDCTLLETSHNDALDQTLCAIVLRFRFRPATDRSGRPVASFKALRFDWRMPSQ